MKQKKFRRLGCLCLAVLMTVVMAVTAFAEGGAVSINKKDGEYSVDVAFSGGSGRSTVSSPATLIVKEGKAYARIQWSSSNYDYMIVNGEKYLPLSGEKLSTFEIPITVFDEPMNVIGDTVAMSKPHEVEYTLTFAEASISGGGSFPMAAGIALTAAVVVGLGIIVMKKKRK